LLLLHLGIQSRLKYSVDVFQVLKVESVSIYNMLKFFTTVYKNEKYNEKKCFSEIYFKFESTYRTVRYSFLVLSVSKGSQSR